jgi:hypothetical protein
LRHLALSGSSLRILCPNGHLGFAPIKTASFRIGLDWAPDLICADSGSCDVGPGPLGADVSSSPLQWQRHDLEHMLLGARRLGVPMIVGSAGDTGSNSAVDRFVAIIKDIAREHRLARSRIGYFDSKVGKDSPCRNIGAGDAIGGLDRRPPLDLATLGVYRPGRGAGDPHAVRYHLPRRPAQGGRAGGVIRGVRHDRAIVAV